jgi:hypothetical protein
VGAHCRDAMNAHQQQFAALLWRFNRHIASLAHPSWLEPLRLDKPVPPSVYLSDYLLQTQAALGEHDWSCDAPAKRLLLLDTASLSAVLLAFGGLVHAQALRRVLQRERRAALHDAWPQESWWSANDTQAPALPAHAAATALPADALDCARSGARLLHALLDGAWTAVRARAHLRLPRAWANDAPLALHAAERDALVAWATTVWVPQRSATWAWLF